MYLIKTPKIADPKVNLAIEEYVVRNLDISKDYLFVYTNSPAVIIGKNQNPFEEVNLSFLKEKKCEMIRRISGGGAVYHEKGNINFSFITASTKQNFNNYTGFLQPVVQLMNGLNVPAKINPRNDIVIGEKKISGNAQFTSRKRMLSHGTLLYNANLERVSAALKVNTDQVESKSTKSVKSKVTNLSDYLYRPIPISNFKKSLIEGILKSFSFEGYIEFDQIQWKEIIDLSHKKYSTWDWNWGRTPKFKVSSEEKVLKFKATLEIINGYISKIIFVDSGGAIKELVSSLQNRKYTIGEIEYQIKLNNRKLDIQSVQRLIKALFPF